MRLFLCCFLGVAVVSNSSVVHAQRYDNTLRLSKIDHRDDISVLPLQMALDLILNAQVNPLDATFIATFIFAKVAYAEPDSSLIPQLKQIADAYAGMTSNNYSYRALLGAQHHGASADYFINLAAQQLASDLYSWYGMFALWVISIRADSTIYQQALPLKALGGHGISGVQRIESTLERDNLLNTRSLEEQVFFLLRSLDQTFSFPHSGPSHQYAGADFGQDDMNPVEVWARERLAQLAQQHPATVRAVVASHVERVTRDSAVFRDAFEDHLLDYAGLKR